MTRTVTIFVLSIVLMTFVSGQKPDARRGSAEEPIRAVLQVTAEGWNAGDLSKYLFAYVPEATEMLSTGPAGGVEAIEKTMKEGFWKTGRPIQQLRYENIVVRMLGKENALVTGQSILSGAERPDRNGWFTTVWTKTKAGWRMIH
ncbi:MAG: nuclear transport factor 2 family protein, partial [Acidobacteriota bacterium]